MIEFQYFQGCPNSMKTLDNLKQLIEEDFIKEELKIVEILDVNSAEQLSFQGSPSILFDGYDIYSEIKPNSFSYSCRIYNIEGNQTGILSKEYIKSKIAKLRD